MNVLVLVDLQNSFIDGELGTQEAQAIIPRIVDKLNNYSNKSNTLVLMTKDTHYDTYLDTLEGTMLPIPHCIENTSGWSINREVKDAVRRNRFLSCSKGDIINGRIYKNTFGSDVLRNYLKENSDIIESVEFVGLTTDICVISNVLMAREALPDKEIYVDKNCCAGTTIEKHLAALEVMKSCQINII